MMYKECIEMIKAIIFDMDGLMIDSERVTCDGYAVSLQKRGYKPSTEFYKKTLGTNTKTTYELYKQEYGDDIPFFEILNEVHQYIEDVFEQQGVPLKPGLVELLKYLKSQHYKTIIATSSERSRVQKILKQTQLSSYFDDYICGDEVENSKPDPEIFLKACQKLKVSHQEALVLEDSEAGIQAAYLAHITVVCVPDMKYPQSVYQQKTLCIVSSLEKIKDIFTLNK